jgi:hypothetical protein
MRTVRSPFSLLYSLFFLLNFISVANAEETATPTDIFRGATQYQTLMCGIKAKIAFQEVELGKISDVYGPISECLKEGKLAVKKVFPKALAKANKKPVAAKLLKEYYSTWLTSFDAISPRTDDRVVDYKKRMADLDTKTDAAWNSFEIEYSM